MAFILDVSERKRAEEKSRFLMQEVNHRAKNLLAIVQAMALQTARDSHEVDFINVFLNRLASLSSCHDLVVKSDWQG